MPALRMDPSEIREDEAFDTQWYHAIELAPGLYTPGKSRRPVALTRELLRHIDIESGGADGGGARCLDVGLQEGLVSILMERRGASEVVGYDRFFRKDRLDLAKRALDMNFELLGDMKLQDFPPVLFEAGHAPLDVVIFSGVLYHMFDPLGGLAVVRGLVRNGGICVVESAVVFEDSYTMHFNNLGKFVSGGNPRQATPGKPREGMMPGAAACFWYVTARCLDYLLRFLRFEPLDLVYFDVAGAEDGKPPEGRVAVACRAIEEPIAEPGDEWILRSQRKTGLSSEFLSWHKVASKAPEVGYDASRQGLVRGEAGSIDIPASIDAMDPFPVDDDQTRLALDAKY